MTTALTATQARPAPRPARAAPLTAARLLRIELRRSAVPWILPLVAALFWFDSYRPSTTQPPFWILRTFWNMGQGHTIIDFGPFVAGVAAWMGSRDGRRDMADLIAGTPRPRWVAQLATWAATALWALAAYLGCVGVMFAVYAHQGLQGTPPWWWVAVGAAAVVAFSAAGFAVGVWFPSRYAAPVAAFGGFVVMMLSSQTGFSHATGWAQILPTNSNGNFQLDSGMLYPYLPDLPIARISFLAGITLALLGALGLTAQAGEPWLRRIAAAVVVGGIVVAATGVGLASTARLTDHGMAIPALHDAASDRPIAAATRCQHAAGIPVCISPAYGRYLSDLTTALRPVLAELDGLPGAPSAARQIAAPYSASNSQGARAMTITGSPPVLRIPLGTFYLPGSFGSVAAEFDEQVQLLSVHAFVVPSGGPGTPAQQAVQSALLQGAGDSFAGQPALLSFAGLPGWSLSDLLSLTDGHDSGDGPGNPYGLVYAAARRLANLPAASRRAWLRTHLAAVRSGQLALGRMP